MSDRGPVREAVSPPLDILTLIDSSVLNILNVYCNLVLNLF